MFATTTQTDKMTIGAKHKQMGLFSHMDNILTTLAVVGVSAVQSLMAYSPRLPIMVQIKMTLGAKLLELRIITLAATMSSFLVAVMRTAASRAINGLVLKVQMLIHAKV